MAFVVNDPKVQGHLPLKAENLPANFAPLSAGDEKVQRAAEMLRNPSQALFEAYELRSNSLQDLMGELEAKNGSITKLRDVKQQIRQLDPNGVLDLDLHPEIRDQLKICIEKHGLLIDPTKTKYTKDELRSLMESINDCCDNHSDTGDVYRLKFKKASSDIDVLVRLISEWISSEGSRAMAVVSNFRSH